MTNETSTRLYIIIGEKIKKHRGKFSQEELAEKVGLSRASIANIETGRQHPAIDTIWNIASALKIDPHLLIPSVDEVKLKYDDIYLKQMQISEPRQKWIKGIIEKGVAENGKDNK